MVFGIEHGVLNPFSLKIAAEGLGLFDGHGADENRLALFMTLKDVPGHCLKFRRLGRVDRVLMIGPDHGLIGGDGDHVQIVNRGELVLLCFGCAGHARELIKHTEVVLKGDGGNGLCLGVDRDIFLGLDGLMQPV